jgi:protein-disulfide isomerase
MFLVVGTIAVETGCSRERVRPNRPLASAAPSAGASAVAFTGPCSGFVTPICSARGQTSQTCQQVKAVSELLSPATCRAASRDTDFALKKLEEKAKDCALLANRLCSDLGQESETCQSVQTQVKSLAPEQCSKQIARYQDLLKELKRAEDGKKPLDSAKQALLRGSDAPAFGPPDAKVTIVEFSDFQCPFCSRAASVTQQVKEKYGDQVRFIFRQFPLSFHANARTAAEASLAAHAQGKFWEFHDKLFQNQQALDAPSLERYAKEVGLQTVTFKQALEDKRFALRVEADLKLGQEVSVQGTPTMFLNGKRIDKPTDFAAVSKMIDQALGA